MSGVQQIADERQRQITNECWSAEHDDQHRFGELWQAAQAYLNAIDYFTDPPHARTERPSYPWPFESRLWKPSLDNRKNLVKAGALIAAEIDRLDRLEAKEE